MVAHELSNATTDRDRPTNARWTRIAPTLLLLWIVSTIDKGNISFVIADPAFIKELRLSNQHVLLGGLASGLFLAYGLGAPFWGWAVKRIGARHVAIISVLLWAATCFIGGLSSSYGELLFSRVLLGFAEAAMYPTTLSLLANWFPLRERGQATAIWWIGTMIGPMISGLAITAMIASVGWRWQFHGLAILVLVLPFPLVVAFITSNPEASKAVNQLEADIISAGALENDRGPPGIALKRSRHTIWLNYRFWLAVAAIAANSLFWWGWSTWLPTYLKTERHFSFSSSGYLTFLIYGCAVVAILLFGKLSDDAFRRAPFSGLGWLFGAIFLGSAAWSPSPTLCVVFMILSLCCQQVGILCAEIVIHSIVKASDMAETQGVRAFVSSMVGAVSPTLIGYILSTTGGFNGVFLLLTGAVLIASGCMALLSVEGL